MEKRKENKIKTQRHRQGLIFGLADLMPDCWLEVSLHSKGPATGQRFSVVFLGPRANAELVPKSHVALHASHAALPMVTLKISPYTNVILTFNFDFGLDHHVHGGYG
jgi:hypothetical protein